MSASPAAAQSTCDAQHRFTLDWSARPNAQLNPGGSYPYTVTNAAGDSLTVTVSFAGDTADLIAINGMQTPYVGSYYTGGLGAGTKTLVIGSQFNKRHNNIDGTANVMVVRFAFSQPVREVGYSVFDVDFNKNQFRDWVKTTGSNGASVYDPFLNTPYDLDGPPPNNPAGSSAFLGPYVPGGTQPLSVAEAIGVGASDIDQNIGTVTAAFTQPLTQLELRYANGPRDYTTGKIGIQGIGIHNIGFCPMPTIAVSKSAAPLATIGVTRFAVPAGDMVYTITVTNSGGSTVDLATLSLTDLIPADVTFYDGDFDPASPGMGPFAFTAGSSGVACCTGVVTYASGTPTRVWGYLPVAGYDGAVTGVRWAPGGAMAANSNFSIRFRVRIK